MSVSLNFRLIADNLDRTLALTAAQAPVKLESEYYKERIGSITSIDEFLEDTRVFRFAMTAFGLEDLAFAKGYLRKILEEGVSDPQSLANRLNDPRFVEFASVFDFASFEDLTTSRSVTQQAVVDRYVRQTLESDAGETDEGVRLALYFQRQAPTVQSALDILADPALAEVARTVMGLPSAFAGADIDRQAAVLAERLDIESFSDPEALDRLLTQFTAIWDATVNPQRDPILILFGAGGGTAPTLSVDLALSLQTLRLGGA